MQIKNNLFEPGAVLVYYNLWTNWDSEEIRESLVYLELDDVLKLSPGDRVWVHIDPLSSRGKVYGYVFLEIEKIEKVEKGKFISVIFSGVKDVKYLVKDISIKDGLNDLRGTLDKYTGNKLIKVSLHRIDAETVTLVTTPIHSGIFHRIISISHGPGIAFAWLNNEQLIFNLIKNNHLARIT
ncbi:MAG: hypothetical protein UT05_C0001G0085 [Parcubacteria group bacterium GW2011_GWF2_38_76]|nr:MAG: hypothetical protein UT05_C0001G0085 [Parcubacteria group bacterium GW2011_GWF2_38_76]HBM45938.1 hypothetical protein [Patescibacteria group bacterium]